jgi:hypothetical protein
MIEIASRCVIYNITCNAGLAVQAFKPRSIIPFSYSSAHLFGAPFLTHPLHYLVFASWAIAIHSLIVSFFTKFSRATIFWLAAGASASPMLLGALLFLESRHQSCPTVHIFDATCKRDHSTSIKWLRILRSSRSHDRRCQPRSTEEQIIYPATVGNTYGSLAEAGVRAVTNQTRRLCW